MLTTSVRSTQSYSLVMALSANGFLAVPVKLRPSLSLNVADLDASREFYDKLGFERHSVNRAFRSD